MPPKRIIIIGAAGRDFHNFNMVFRGNKNYKVLAFTAAQIPNIENRIYPKELAGYDIPIYPEEKLPGLIKRLNIDAVVLSYSDLSYKEVMRKASIAMASGADFWLLGPNATMLHSKKPVIAITATRTGAGKSPLTRDVISLIKKLRPEANIIVIRHPMPYGRLSKKVAVQRFAAFEDLKKCTFEEIEEYQPHIELGTIVYAGIDYGMILRQAEKEADVIIWDGGNNDFPFIKPDLWFCVADSRRPGHETGYYPGEINFRAADIIIINKVSDATRPMIETIEVNARRLNKDAKVLHTDLAICSENSIDLKGKKVLAIEDGPTITHGGLPDGAAAVFVRRNGGTLVDPRAWAVGSITQAYKKYHHIGHVLPCIGYSKRQMTELEQTINRAACDIVICGTPLDITRFLHINKPVYRVKYNIKFLSQKDAKVFEKEITRII